MKADPVCLFWRLLYPFRELQLNAYPRAECGLYLSLSDLFLDLRLYRLPESGYADSKIHYSTEMCAFRSPLRWHCVTAAWMRER